MPKVATSNTTGAPSESSSSSRPTKRGKNAFISCDDCRRRQIRCDGVAPSLATPENPERACSACIKREEECTWTGKRAGRLAIPRPFVEAQENLIAAQKATIDALVAKLKAHGLSPDSVMPDSPPRNQPPDAETEDDEISGSLSRLVIEHDSLAGYGNVSPFSDLPSRDDIHRSSSMSIPMYETSPVGHLKSNASHKLCTTMADVLALDPQKSSDWLRYLPEGCALTRIEHDIALHRFFTFFSSWCLRAIPHLFLRDLALATSFPGVMAPKTPHYSPIFHNSIMSVALAYSDDVRLRSRVIRDQFAKKAKEYIEMECHRPTLSTVQALAALSSYHSGFGEQGLGFMYFGMSTRMCQALGLNVSCADWVRTGYISFSDMIERNTIFWSIFVQDKCWSLYVGRDHGLPLPRSDVRLPQILSFDDDATPSSSSHHSENSSSVFLAFLETVALMKVGAEIMDVVYGMSGASHHHTGTDIHRVVSVYSSLTAWANALPASLRIHNAAQCTAPPHTLALNMAYHWLTLLLLRPFFKPSSSSRHTSISSPSTPLSSFTQVQRQLRDTAVKNCPMSARHIRNLFFAYRRLYGLRFSTITAVQIAYTAGRLFAAMAIAGLDSKKAKEGVNDFVGILREIGQTWGSGNVTANILENLHLGGVKDKPIPTSSASVQDNVIPPSIADKPHQVSASNLSPDHLNYSYQSTPPFNDPMPNTFGGSDRPTTHELPLLDATYASDVWPSLPEYPNGLDLDQFEAGPSGTMQTSLQDQISLSLDDLFSPNFATSTSSLSVSSPLVRSIPEIDYDFFGGRWDIGDSLR